MSAAGCSTAGERASCVALGTVAAVTAVDVALRSPLSAGWMRLTPGCADVGAARLVLHHVDGAVVEHIVDFAEGARERILHVDAAVARAEIAAVSLTGDRAPRTARLSRLGFIGVVRAAFARDPREAGAAIWWRLIGKKVRARNRLLRVFGQTHRADYAAWLERRAPAWQAEIAQIEAGLAASPVMPRLAVVVTASDAAAQVRAVAASLASIDAQSMAVVRRIVAADRARDVADRAAEAWAEVAAADRFGDTEADTGAEAEAGQGAHWDWLVVLPAGTQLRSDAIVRIAAAVADRPEANVVHGDSDTIDARGMRGAPQLTPQWNAAYFLARDYVGMFAIKRAVVDVARESLEADDTLDALLLAAARGESGIVRIPRVLSHRYIGVKPSEPAGDAEEMRRATFERWVRRREPGARVKRERYGLRLVRTLPLPAPLVSLIVPTRDRVDLLRPCIESLRGATDYPAIEIIVANNGSEKAATRAYFDVLADDTRVRILDCPGPFNFAAINNRAVAAARGTVLGFINNDIEAMHADWLAEMVSHAARPDVGAVGALLVYANGLVQHAGVVMGVGGYAGHAHRFFHPDAPGYMSRIACQQNVAAVTAACLVVERAKFEAVGGFDAETFAVAYNDVDLCLKLRRAGWENFYTPYARLKHKESASRVRDYAPERAAAYARECAALTERWGDIIADDPYYHPALTRADETFSID